MGLLMPELPSGGHPRATERRSRRTKQQSSREHGDPGAYSRGCLPFGRRSLLSRSSTAEPAATTRVRLELEEVNPTVGEHVNHWRLRIGMAFQWSAVVPENLNDRQFHHWTFGAGSVARRNQLFRHRAASP
jgi:hypothetical protein